MNASDEYDSVTCGKRRGVTRHRWLWPTVGLCGIVLFVGVAWYLAGTGVEADSKAIGMFTPNVPQTLPWPADIREFTFVDPNVRDLAVECDAIARRVYSDLPHGNYDARKPDVKPEAIVARWCVVDEDGVRVHVSKTRSPGRSASIHLSQNSSGEVFDVILIGAARLADGWTASIQYSSVHKSLFHVGLSRNRDAMTSNGRDRIDLVNPSLQTGTDLLQENMITVSLKSSLDSDADLIDQSSGGQAIAPFFRSAESLRDESLRRLDLLENKMREQIRLGAGFTETDWQDVRSDNPPVEHFRATAPLSEEEQEVCLRQATKLFEERRTLIRKNHLAIHEAVVRAFPFYVAIVSASEEGD